MAVFRNLIRGILQPTVLEERLPDAFATTLHDALRISTPRFERMKNDFSEEPTGSVSVQEATYEDLAGLQAQLRRIDALGRSGGRINVVLVWNDSLRCDLRALLERDSLGHRLVLVRGSRPLPGLLSPADLTLLAPKLGWLQIRVGADFEEELNYLQQSLGGGERVVVLRPAFSSPAGRTESRPT